MPLPHELGSPTSLFALSVSRHERIHGPRGYADYEHFKPWLRDEFGFRCIYCLCREVWFPDGDRSFSVEHIVPRSKSPHVMTEYETLGYACCQCNAARGAALLPLDPTIGLGLHLEALDDGTIRPKTPIGEELIEICRLNRANLVAFRKLMIDALSFLGQKREPEASDLCRRYFAYPVNLPNLATLRPPGGNSRPEGIAQCAFERRQRDELPAVY